ncbi:MAG: hypothetical protein JWL76_1794 [Thermoleophilia bacterium]|nr:hypothetical protein [Thermoleophilia bacterium]
MAAVLAHPDGCAFVTGRAAAWLRRAVRRAPTKIDVVITTRSTCRADDVSIRSTRSIHPSEAGFVDGIPVTSVPRMLVDMADTTVVTELADVMHELDLLDLLNVRALRASIRRHRTRRGPAHRRISNALALNRSESAGTQSHLERRVLDDLLERGAPMPRITPRVTIGGRRIRPDLLFEAHGLVVEIDGRPHQRRRTKVDDERKTELLESIGLRVMRIDARSRRRDTDAVLRVFGLTP